MRLLSIRPRGRTEISRALADRGYDRTAVQGAVDRLEREGLLDDLAAARSAVRTRGERYGTRRLERELRARGFSRETVERALAERDPDREETALSRALERAWKSNARLPSLIRRRRVLDSLARRGFSPEKVSEMIDRFERSFKNGNEGQRGPRTVS
ncbi:MAG TPA: regulatory protein RecX [Thermoanaerobaculia bacterium]